MLDSTFPGGFEQGTTTTINFDVVVETACHRADVDGNGVVNVLDLIDLLLCFGQPATPPCDTGQDINGDGTVSVLDLIALLLAFGTACP